MSQKLQVLIRHAKSAKRSIGTWVRVALRRMRASESSRPVEEKLKATERAFSWSEPVGTMDEMKSEISSGYLK